VQRAEGGRVCLPHGCALIADSPGRIAVIDFIRGAALLGILAINVTGFWGPQLATYSPLMPRDEPSSAIWYAIAFVLFEGKMRGLFTVLFGASLLLFVEAAERRGANGDLAQARRLCWLALIGYAHYLLLWWGDILFAYALCGLLALALRRMPPAGLAALGLMLFVVSHGLASIGDLSGIAAEGRVLAGRASPPEMAEQAALMERIAASIALDTQILNAGFVAAIRLKLANAPFLPLETTLSTLTETFPLILLGMGLYGSGFFGGDWSRRALRMLAWAGISGGGAITLALLSWIWQHHFPPRAMFAMLGALTALPHLAMALGYAAALLLAWPHIEHSRAARRIAAAGRTALSNYLGTTVLMCAIFAGWGLGLGPEMPRGWLPAFVVLGWAVMLIWPEAWLARFGIGPVEALWRKLTWWGEARAFER
jgi:uncharacterized protein